MERNPEKEGLHCPSCNAEISSAEEVKFGQCPHCHKAMRVPTPIIGLHHREIEGVVTQSKGRSFQ